MSARDRLQFGLLAAVILASGIGALPLMIPGYDPVRQTVSEIGEVGSPMRWPFAMVLAVVAVCILVFASGVRRVSLDAGHVRWPAYVAAFMAVPAVGIAVFPFPHPVHNVFGILELIGYQAPMAFALTWGADRRARAFVIFCWFMSAAVWMAIAANLVIFDRHGALWTFEKPFYGLVQRALFGAWFVWCAGTAVLLRSYTEPRSMQM